MLLELFFTLCVAMIVFPGAVQVDIDTMLQFYFDYYGVPFSFGSMAGTVAGALQLSEPLPAWALTSRLCQQLAPNHRRPRVLWALPLPLPPRRVARAADEP